MKPAYDNLSLTTGVHEGGLYKVEVVPIEWLSEKITQQFAYGTIFPPSLVEGKEWLVLNFTPESYQYASNQKTSKGGSYFETEIGGLKNDIDYTTLQILETLRYHQFVVRATDLKKQVRVCGNIDAGMTLLISDDNTNSGGGKLSVGLNFQMQHAKMNPVQMAICVGYENFTDVEFTIPDVIPVTSMAMNFSGGNLVGATEVQIINLPGATHDLLMAEGVSFIFGDAAFWAPYLSTATYRLRWRRRCPAGQFSAWREITANNPFF